MSTDEQAIRDLIGRWQAPSSAGQVDGVLALMTDDVVFLVPGRPPFGKEEFAAASRQQAGVRFEVESTIDEIVVDGDHAYCRASLVVTAAPPGKPTIRRAGCTLTIFRKQGVRWLLARDANLLGAASPE